MCRVKQCVGDIGIFCTGMLTSIETVKDKNLTKKNQRSILL